MSVNREQSFAVRKRDRSRLRRGTGRAVLAVALLAAGRVLAQETPANPSATPQPPAKVPWAISITVDGYIPPEQDGYVSPIVTADHGWLHLEARYNYEDLRTGSVWIGYNFSAGKKLVLNLTPMIGGVFGRTTGIAPGCLALLSYRKFKLYIPNEYVFDTNDSHGNFYYSAPELTYSPTGWLPNVPRRFRPSSTFTAVSWSASPINTRTSRPTSTTQAGPTRPFCLRLPGVFED